MLSTTSQYAIRALSCLARMSPTEAVLGRELSEKANVPATYLSKMMLVMRNAGLIEATRGAGGGYRLAKPPASISLLDIIRVFDPEIQDLPCFMSESDCGDNPHCDTHSRWERVRAEFLGFLNETTLEELAANPHRQAAD